MSDRHLEDKGLLARGGMATVHRVRDVTLRRDIAMKLLKRELSARPNEVERFTEEAQVTAQLDHPYIPAVHELGVAADGRHFFTMKLVEGRTLDEILLDKKADPNDPDRLFRLVQIFIKVCEAVSFAHARGVVHCDLKPPNIMVGTHGQVFVMDWGIARLAVDREGAGVAEGVAPVTVARSSPRNELKGKVLGTLGYLSPEQVRGDPEDIDHRSDVFSLGALLYRIVVGTTAYPVSPTKEALARAMFAEITPPEQAAPGRTVSKRLCAIALKAMKLEKEDRYQTVDELRADVEAWVRGAGRHPTRVVKAGEAIIREGEPGTSAFIISRGRVLVFKLINGRRQVLAEMGPGEMFGEAAIFTTRGRTATVEALEETTLVEVSRESLEEELQGTFVMGDLVRVLARRFHELDAQTKALRERVDDWALHGTVMTHFALHGETVGPGERAAKWSPLKQVLVEHLQMPEERAVRWVRSMKGMRLDEAGDRIILSASGAAPEALPSPTLPELSIPGYTTT